MRYKTISTLMLLPVLIALLLLPPAPAAAQGNIDRDRVRAELDRTEEIIREAAEVINTSRSQKSRVKIERAKEIQGMAEEAYGRKADQTALKLTFQARDEANQALGLARLEIRLEEQFHRMAEETVERLAKVRDIMVEAGIRDQNVMKLAEESKALLEKARENAHQLRFQLAMKLAETARQRAVQAEQRVRRVLALKEMNERRLALMERLVDRARDRVHASGNEQAMRQLRLAEDQFQKAKALHGEGRYQAARVAIEMCEKTLRGLIRRFTNQALGDPGAMLDEAYRLLERAEEIVAAGGVEAAGARSVERAREILARAGTAIAAGRMDEARRLTAEARNLLRNALRKEHAGENEAATREMIGRVEALSADTAAMLESCTAPGARTLMDRATTRLEQAKRYLAEGRIRNAAAEAKIARNLFNRIKEICSTL